MSDRAKYHPGDFLVLIFNEVGTKIKTESGFISNRDASDWRDSNTPPGGSGVLLRVIHNTRIDMSRDNWEWAGELPEDLAE